MSSHSSQGTILEVHNLRKTYGHLEALRGVSFTLAPGEVFGYLGPNGSGKTTTLRIIVGLVHQTAGDVVLFGERVERTSGRSTLRMSIGYLPGELHLHENLGAGEALDFYAGFRPQRPPVLRNRLLEALQLDSGSLKKKIKHLSHGTRQKLGLIVAMQHDPELLLLDEPTLGLDPLVQKSFGEIVHECAARGRAILFSSHILSEVEALCSRVAILRAGHIVAQESIESLRAMVMRKVHVRLSNRVPIDLSSVPGVKRVMTAGNEITIWVRGDVNPLIRALGHANVEHIVFPEAELEDIFFSYYSSASQEHA